MGGKIHGKIHGRGFLSPLAHGCVETCAEGVAQRSGRAVAAFGGDGLFTLRRALEKLQHLRHPYFAYLVYHRLSEHGLEVLFGKIGHQIGSYVGFVSKINIAISGTKLCLPLISCPKYDIMWS